MNYADIKEFDVANGPGVRISLFVSGCTHHCKGCFNEVAWDFDYGTPFTEETVDKILELLKPDYVAGLTILGGEPFEPENQKAVLALVKRVREVYPGKSIWCYSGYDFEKDMLGTMSKNYPETLKLLQRLDILVDGKFELEKKDLGLRFRGSSNQRIIKVPESLQQHKIVLWEGMNA